MCQSNTSLADFQTHPISEQRLSLNGLQSEIRASFINALAPHRAFLVVSGLATGSIPGIIVKSMLVLAEPAGFSSEFTISVVPAAGIGNNPGQLEMLEKSCRRP